MLRAFVIALACLAAAGCSYDRHSHPDGDFTYSEPHAGEPVVKYADANHDGDVTRDEAGADAALTQAFDRYDLDRNDQLDRGEFARLEDERRARDLEVIPVPADEDSVRAARQARRAQPRDPAGTDEIRPAEPYKD